MHGRHVRCFYAAPHPKVVQRHLGHSSIQVTLARQRFPDVEESLVEALDALHNAPTASNGNVEEARQA